MIITPITKTLFYFNNDEIQLANVDNKPFLIFARACDINALSRLDCMYFKNGNTVDSSYSNKRSETKYVLMECTKSFENCFCVSMETNRTENFCAAVRFGENGVDVQIRDPEIEWAFKNLGTPSNYHIGFITENDEKVRTPDQVCDDPKRIQQILIGHTLYGTTIKVGV